MTFDMQEQFGDKGYRYNFVVHRDTDNPHIHVIVNNYNIEPDGPKLRLNQPELFELRTKFAEKLSELGLVQTATLKRDRETARLELKKDKALESTVSNWLQSKIKTASLDPKDYRDRKAQYHAIQKALETVKATGRETEASIQARDDLRQMAHSLSIVDRYKNERSAFRANKELMSEKGEYSDLVKSIKSGKVVEPRDKTKEAKKLGWQARKMAFDLAEGELATRSNNALNDKQKKTLQKDFDKRMSQLKPYLAKGSIEKIRFITAQKSYPDNEKTADLARSIKKLDRSVPNLEEKQKAGELTEKQSKRVASDLFKAQKNIESNELSGWRRKDLSKGLKDQEKALSKIVDLDKLRRQWENGQSLTERLDQFKTKAVVFKENQSAMNREDRAKGLDRLQREGKDIEVKANREAYDPKQRVTISKSAQAVAKGLSGLRSEETVKVEKECTSISRGIVNLGKKLEQQQTANDKGSAFQGERLGIRYIRFEAAAKGLNESSYDQERLLRAAEEQKAKLTGLVDLDKCANQVKVIDKVASENQQLSAKVSNITPDLSERRQVNVAVEAISAAQKRDDFEKLPSVEKRSFASERNKAALDVDKAISPAAREKVQQYFSIDKEIKDISRFSENIQAKYKEPTRENRAARKKAEFVVNKKLEGVLDKMNKAELPRRAEGRLNKLMEKDRGLSKAPAIQNHLSRSAGREIGL